MCFDYCFVSLFYEVIIKWVIYIIVDFDWLDILWFFVDVLEQFCDVLCYLCIIYIDIMMVLFGINKRLLVMFGGECCCYISELCVVCVVKMQGIICLMVVVDIVIVEEEKNKFFVFGNVLMVLFCLFEYNVMVSGVVGVLVGFVGVVEFKEVFIYSYFFVVVVLGCKGGSNVVVVIVNVLFYYFWEV